MISVIRKTFDVFFCFAVQCAEAIIKPAVFLDRYVDESRKDEYSYYTELNWNEFCYCVPEKKKWNKRAKDSSYFQCTKTNTFL